MSDIIDEMGLWQILGDIRRHTKQKNYNSAVFVDIELSDPLLCFYDISYEKFWFISDEEIKDQDLEIRELFEDKIKIQWIVAFLNWQTEMPRLQKEIEKWDGLRGFW